MQVRRELHVRERGGARPDADPAPARDPAPANAPGDHTLLDGALEALAAAGLGADALTLRCRPADGEAVAAAVADALAAGAVPGTLARSAALLVGAQRGVERSGRVPGSDVHFGVADLYGTAVDEHPRTASARPTAAAEEHGERLGRLLLERATRPGAAPRHERLAVELVVPTRRDS